MSAEKTIAIRDGEFEAASRRAADRLRTTATATSARYDRRTGRIVIQLSSGLEVAFRPHDVQRLENARPDQLRTIQITASGLGIRFPQIDADLYLPAVLERFLGSKHWFASEMGKVGGKVSTDAKAAAARRNGRLGGRPKSAKQMQPA